MKLRAEGPKRANESGQRQEGPKLGPCCLWRETLARFRPSVRSSKTVMVNIIGCNEGNNVIGAPNHIVAFTASNNIDYQCLE